MQRTICRDRTTWIPRTCLPEPSSLIWSVKDRLTVARIWLAGLITALSTGAIVVRWLSPYRLVFAEISELRQMPTFCGEHFALATGPANPGSTSRTQPRW